MSKFIEYYYINEVYLNKYVNFLTLKYLLFIF
jgi:hypothetical protein